MVVGVLLEVPPLFLCDMCEGDLATTPAGLSGKTAEFFSRQNFAPSPIHDHGRYQRQRRYRVQIIDGGGVVGGRQQLQVLQRRLVICDEWNLPHHPRGPPVCVSMDKCCKY